MRKLNSPFSGIGKSKEISKNPGKLLLHDDILLNHLIFVPLIITFHFPTLYSVQTFKEKNNFLNNEQALPTNPRE